MGLSLIPPALEWRLPLPRRQAITAMTPALPLPELGEAVDVLSPSQPPKSQTMKSLWAFLLQSLNGYFLPNPRAKSF
jgi:hypothetical protein